MEGIQRLIFRKVHRNRERKQNPGGKNGSHNQVATVQEFGQSLVLQKTPLNVSQTSGGAKNNLNITSTNLSTTLSNFGTVQSAKDSRGKSLNKHTRQMELLRVAKENSEILKRLQGQRSEYSVSKWNHEESKRKKLLKQMNEYSSLSWGGGTNANRDISTRETGASTQLRKKRHVMKNSFRVNQTLQNFNEQIHSIEQEDLEERKINMKQSLPALDHTAKTPSSARFSSQTPAGTTLHNKRAQSMPKQRPSKSKQVLFMIKKMVKKTRDGTVDLPEEPQLFEICIYLTQKGKLKIRSRQVKGLDLYHISIPSKKKEALLKQFKGDFKFLVDNLRVMENRMVLLNPKQSSDIIIEEKTPQQEETKAQNSTREEGDQIDTRNIAYASQLDTAQTFGDGEYQTSIVSQTTQPVQAQTIVQQQTEKNVSVQSQNTGDQK